MARASSFASRQYRDHGVILRTHKLGEADRIIVLLTRRHGQVRAVAKGVRRTSSKFGARLEPFMVADLQLVTGRNLDIVSQAESVASYGQPIVADYGKYTAAAAICETAERLSDIDTESASSQYGLLLGALHALAAGTHSPQTVLDSYLLRALADAGWAPSFTDCARCGAPGLHRAFSVPVGGVVCPVCRPPGSASPDPGTLALLAALLAGDWAGTVDADPGQRNEASGLVAAFAQYHLERSVRSLKHIERV
ncbi:DNA repair protein RecO [Tersicoccus phoenicis]|uniref:DNA repair protein RecO n=1 Tax=Tersicoccus phoenicis TaxID=554083 RepID=A0A1R1LER4_9MICC|nr:DNA repair protein RecO [Tersicoccus phoenicis]OMH26026.1 DNA repair protein RecO [Tersicoccus phoenicis]